MPFTSMHNVLEIKKSKFRFDSIQAVTWRDRMANILKREEFIYLARRLALAVYPAAYPPSLIRLRVSLESQPQMSADFVETKSSC